MSAIHIALALRSVGIAVIPIRLDRPKQPACSTWGGMPSEAELHKEFQSRRWATKPPIQSTPGLAALGGQVSGGLECIDFDEPGLFELWADMVDAKQADLLGRLVIVKTPSGGRHCWYRCDVVEGNHDLALRPATAEELAENPKQKTYKLIETRGEGGYALLPGCPKHCHKDHGVYTYDPAGCGELTSVQRITPAERETLLSLARSFNKVPKKPVVQTSVPAKPLTSAELMPGVDFDARGYPWQEILEPAGWQLVTGTWEDGRVARPGKDPRDGYSATIGHCRGPNNEPLLNVFSSSDADFPVGAYGKFRAWAALHHRNDLGKAASALARLGFGSPAKASKQTSSAQSPDAKPWEIKPIQSAPTDGISLAQLMLLEIAPPKYAVEGLLCEGLTILGGKPKMGKSWLSLLIAWAVAADQQIDGRSVSGGDVLFLALEDTPRRIQSRVKMLLPAVGWEMPERLTIHTNWGRSDQGGLYYLAEWLAKHKGTARLVVIDTLAKFRAAKKGNANGYDSDYEDVGQIKKLCDEYGVSALLIHHTRKLKSEDPFDDLSGTLGIGGAADGILILDRDRGHDGGQLYVTGRDVQECTIPLHLDKATYRWTLGEANDGIDTSARAAASPAATKVDQCCRWLLSFLSEYAHPAAEVDQAAKLAGYSGSAVRDAKAKLGREGSRDICFQKMGQQEWWVGLVPSSQWKMRPLDMAKSPKSSDSSDTSESSKKRPDSPRKQANSPNPPRPPDDDDGPGIWPG